MSSPRKRLLLLMRHAKSDWADSRLADIDRPLNERGRSAAPLMANWLWKQSAIPVKVLCSSSVRTRQTLDLMLEFWKRECSHVPVPTIQYFDELYLAPSNRILSIASKNCGDSNLLVVGHNPGMEDLASKLSGEEWHMPTGAIAMFESTLSTWPDDWSQAGLWIWHGLVKPREIGRGTI